MGKFRFEYDYPMGKKAQVGIQPHQPAAWDKKTRRPAHAVRRKFVTFHDGYFGTNDANIARALEATVPFAERREIRRVGAKVAPAPPRAARAASGPLNIEAILLKLGGLPLGSDDGELDAIRLW